MTLEDQREHHKALRDWHFACMEWENKMWHYHHMKSLYPESEEPIPEKPPHPHLSKCIDKRD